MDDGKDDSDDALFDDDFLPFASQFKSNNKSTTREIAELKAKLQSVQWENVELQQKIARRPINKWEMQTILHEPRISIWMLAEFVDRLPVQHKEKIWARHAVDDYIPSDKILYMIHSYFALTIKIKDRNAHVPMRNDPEINSKLIPYAQTVEKQLRNPNGMCKSEFINELGHWLLLPIDDCFLSSHKQLRYNTKRLLSKTDRNNNELMTQCIESITQNVYKADEIIDILIDTSDHKQLQQLYTIIKSVKGDDVNDNDDILLTLSPLYKLPKHCVIQICMFLDRSDINDFKMISDGISVICLEYMSRYMFRICNVNKLLITPQLYVNIPYWDHDCGSEIMSDITYKRNTPFMEVQFEWEEIYKIPIKYQLLYKRNNGFMDMNTFDKRQYIWNINTADRYCFLLDKRNIIVMFNDDNNICKRVMNDMDKIMDYNMIIIQYFNIQKQCLYFKQILCIDKNIITENIINYIMNDFIPLNEDQKINNNQLINELNKNNTNLLAYIRVMDENNNIINENQLELKDKIIDDKYDTNHHIMLMLQINKPKTWIEGMKVEYKKHEQTFFLNPNEFCDKLSSMFTLDVYYLHDSNLFKAYLKSLKTFKESNIKSFDKIFQFIPSGNILLNKFKMYSCDNYGTLRIKISKMLDTSINPKSIQLFKKNDNNSFKILPWNMQCITPYQLCNKQIYFDFINNENDDIKKDESDKLVTYVIKILTPQQCKIPRLDKKDNKINTTLIIKYANKFVFGEIFIEYIMNKIKDQIYGNCFDEILELHEKIKQNDQNKHKNDYEYGYALHKSMRTYFMNEEFIGSTNELKVNVLSLLIYRNPKYYYIVNNDVEEKYRIQITFRFYEAEVDEYDTILVASKHFSGLPVKIWIEDHKRLHDVLVKYFPVIMPHIHKIYKDEDDKRVVDHIAYSPEDGDELILEIKSSNLYT